MFCARLDMAVDGEKNTVSEVDIVPQDSLYGNAFVSVETTLKKEQDAVRVNDANMARSWKVSNAEGKVNPITGKPTAYKLIPFTKGPAQPPLLTSKNSSVSKKGTDLAAQSLLSIVTMTKASNVCFLMCIFQVRLLNHIFG